MKVKSHLLALIGATLLANGCANLSTLQTARVLKPDEGALTLGGGWVQMPDFNNTTQGLVTGVPIAEGMYRHGIIQNLDVGLKATIIGSVGLDAKYQLLDMSGFVLSAGVGGGYTTITAGSNSGVNTTIIDLQMPSIYASYDVTNWFALYVSPKLFGRVVSGSGNVAANGFNLMAGGSAGFKLGDSWGFLGETSYGIPFSKSLASQLQFDGAFFWRFGGKG